MSCCHKEGRTSELVLPFRLALESCRLHICIHFWALNFNKNVNQLERVQKTALGVIRGLKHMAFKGILKELELVLLKIERIERKDMIKKIS